MGKCMSVAAKSVEKEKGVEQSRSSQKQSQGQSQIQNRENINRNTSPRFSDKYGSFPIVRIETSMTNNVNSRLENGKPQIFKLKDLWKESVVAFYLFRRFGCPLCRAMALRISAIGPILEKHGIKLVGIGLNYRSIDGMIQGNYWRDNEIYVNEGATLYKALDLKYASWSSVVIPSKQAQDLNSESKENGIVGDFQLRSLENGRRLGGLFVISTSGDSLYEFRQEKIGEIPPFNEMFEVLGIDPDSFTEEKTDRILTQA